MALDPQAAAFVRRLAEDQTPPIHEMTVERVRSMMLPIAGEPERVGGLLSAVVLSPAGGLPVRVYTPRIETAELDTMKDPQHGRPMLLFLHGGGWVAGGIETHDAICRRLANECRSLVFVVDYRLSPEHKFPAALDDCFTALQWSNDQAEHHGGDAHRLFVIGDSAGGNLAAAVCLKARDVGGPTVRGQILIYPIVNYDFSTDSYRDNATGYHLTTENMKWFWQQYLAEEADGENPLASPLRVADCRGLPPALIVTAEYDPLRDEGLAYADRLADSNVSVDRIHCEGMVHGFFRRLDTFDRAGQLVAEIAEWLNAQKT